MVLFSNKKDNYVAVPPEKSGLYLNGNAKSVEVIEQKLLIATNNGSTKTFEFRRP
jgi:signal recognition particle receptor subunit beta